ncbi:MAG: nucleotide sugar dehydrogenase [candidate division Zixibacteria bacterium]|nr:nucleotide sugar dehydrogenase [candidate division Zixibacteria bacterium]
MLIVGGGYVGLATATFLANRGHRVTVAEKNRYTVESLGCGQLHFHEPSLTVKFRQALKTRRIRVVPPSRQLYQSADIIFVAIDSVNQTTGRMNISAFEKISEWIGGIKRKRVALVILKSTNVLGFAQFFRNMLDDTLYGATVRLAVNPEFLREGFAYDDTEKPNRIVIGVPDTATRRQMVRLYRPLYKHHVPMITTDWKSAELIKLASNLYLSHRLAFVNEIAEYARREKLDVATVTRSIGLDPRIGLEYFEPGLGFGGSCLPKDCDLINSRELGSQYRFQTADTALDINDFVIDGVISGLRVALGDRLKGKKIAVLGAAFKPETDDTRGSQAVRLAIKLKRRGASVLVYDPFLKGASGIVGSTVSLEHNLQLTIQNASAIVIGTAHRRFRTLKAKTASRLVKKRLVADRFRILNRDIWEKEGFRFV